MDGEKYKALNFFDIIINKNMPKNKKLKATKIKKDVDDDDKTYLTTRITNFNSKQIRDLKRMLDTCTAHYVSQINNPPKAKEAVEK